MVPQFYRTKGSWFSSLVSCYTGSMVPLCPSAMLRRIMVKCYPFFIIQKGVIFSGFPVLWYKGSWHSMTRQLHGIIFMVSWLLGCMVPFSCFHGSLVAWYHIFMLSCFLGCMVPFSFVSSLESLAKSSKLIKIGLVKIFPANQTKIIKYLVLGI